METHAIAKCCWCASALVKLEGHWWCQTKACRDKQLAWGIAQQVPKQGKHGDGFQGFAWKRLWVPLPKQVAFLEMGGKRKLLGGAAGPGKSHVSRFGAYRLCLTVPNLSVLLLRKTRPELERTHIRKMRQEQHDIGFTWMEQAKECRFTNGAVIECGHMEDDAAVQKYLSSEYDLIIPEEAVQYPPDPLMELMSRARTSNEKVKAMGGPWVWLPTNPGGPSHHLLKANFIDKTPDIEQYPAMAKSYNPDLWQYLHATLDDNPYIDPDYEELSLSGLRKARYEQLRHGDWDAAEGTFFELFDKRSHVRDIEISKPITGVIESVDWGYTSPGTVAWYVPLADGHWHVLDEWKFQKMTAEEVARGIVDHRARLGITHVSYTVTDPSMHNKTGSGAGESYAETFTRFGVPSRRGDNDRVMGWGRLIAAYRAAPDGVPWLTYSPNCRYSIRSIPALLADKGNPEDVDSKLDDHCLTADTLITTEHGPRPIVDVAVGDRVWTRAGWQRVTACMENGIKPILRVDLSDGTALHITGNHPVWTENRGFIRADALRYSDILVSCRKSLNPWSLTALRSAAIRSLSGLKISAISSRMATGFSGAWNRCIERFGRPHMALFQTGTTFTTWMETPSITTWVTWPALSAAPISRITHHSAQPISRSSSASALSPRRGMGLWPEKSGTATPLSVHGKSARQMSAETATCAENISTDTATVAGSVPIIASPCSAVVRASMPWIASVSSAVRRLRQIVTRLQGLVHRPAPSIVGVSPAGLAPVYNISVEHAPEYFANGILVHNCADRDRYFVQSRPLFSKSKPKAPEEVPNSWAWWRRYHETQSQGSGVLA